MKRMIGMQRLLWILFLAALPAGGLYAEIFVPAGYGQGQNLEGTGYGLDLGAKELEEDYYFYINPSVHFPLWGFRIGLQAPMEFLVWDRDPVEDPTAVTLRKGMYDDNYDYLRFISYIRYGSHLYYDPDDLFNWSFYIGQMNDGYIGHRTIINRYVTSFDPTVHRLGFMADINNRWGGVEVFSSDILRQEVQAGRVFIRPTGIVKSMLNLLAGGIPVNPRRMVAMSRRESVDPELNGGVLYQERIPRAGQGGALQQQFHKPLEESPNLKNPGGNVQFEEYTDPETGKTMTRPRFLPPPDIVPPPGATDRRGLRNRGEGSPGGAESGPGGAGTGSGVAGEASEGQAGAGKGQVADNKEEDEKYDPLTPGFWSRWSIGYTIARDGKAPLSLETDGSGRLVVDPDTLLPRGGTTEPLTIQGYDVELRLSPTPWMDLTPYVDLNRVQQLEKSKGLHVGLDTKFLIGDFLELKVRPEYREMSANYLPVYFNSYYSIERTVYNPYGNNSDTQDTTKYAYLKSLDPTSEKIKGSYLGVYIDWLQNLVIDLSYEDYTGPNNSAIFVGFYVPTIFNVFLNGYYMKSHYDSFNDSFIVDDNSLLAAEAGISFFGGLYVKVSVIRTWQVDETTGGYQPTDEINYGFGFSAVL